MILKDLAVGLPVSIHSKRVMGRQFRLKDGKTRSLAVSIDFERVMAGSDCWVELWDLGDCCCVPSSTGLKPLSYTKREYATLDSKRESTRASILALVDGFVIEGGRFGPVRLRSGREAAATRASIRR